MAELDDVVDVLYAVLPQDFVARRTEAAAEAKAAGDKALAKAVAGLRRPARSAWVLNQLVRAEPDAVDELGALGEELRAAEREMQGPELRRLSGQRTKLVDRLATTALRAAEVADGDADLRREVQETLTAALAEPAVLDGLQTGALVKPVAWSGFGVSTLEDITAVPVTSRTARPHPAATRSESGAGAGAKSGPTQPRSGTRGAAGAKRAKGAAAELAEPVEDAPPEAAPRTAAKEDRGTTARERAAQREQERRERQHAERVDAAERDLAEAEVVYAGAKSEAAEAAAEVARLEAALRTARSESTSAQRETDRARRTRDTARTTLTRVRARRP